MDFLVLAQSSDAGSAIGGIIGGIVMLAVVAVMVAGFWKIYTKAGEPGWAAIVPIYNIVVLLNIAGRPVWWIILFFVPIANIVVPFIVYIDLAKKFGKGAGYGIGMALIPIIFVPLLGFGDAQYGGGANAY